MHHQHFSFERAAFVEVIAHEGTGRIQTTRVLDAEHHSAFRFIDLTQIPPGCSVGVHTHAEDEEVYIIISGRGRMTVDGETFEVGPGHVIRNVPGGTHGLINVGSELLTMVVLDVASVSPQS
jgi:mannose-6-phosphate isomerase-like protein (cupin superfamily)